VLKVCLKKMCGSGSECECAEKAKAVIVPHQEKKPTVWIVMSKDDPRADFFAAVLRTRGEICRVVHEVCLLVHFLTFSFSPKKPDQDVLRVAEAIQPRISHSYHCPDILVTSYFPVVVLFSADQDCHYMALFLGSFASNEYAHLSFRNVSAVAINASTNPRENCASVVACNSMRALNEMSRARAGKCCIVDNSTRLLLPETRLRIPNTALPLYYIDSTNRIYHRIGNVSRYMFYCGGNLFVSPLPIDGEQYKFVLQKLNTDAVPKNEIAARTRDGQEIRVRPILATALDFMNGVIYIESAGIVPSEFVEYFATAEESMKRRCLLRIPIDVAMGWIMQNLHFVCFAISKIVFNCKGVSVAQYTEFLASLKSAQSQAASMRIQMPGFAFVHSPDDTLKKHFKDHVFYDSVESMIANVMSPTVAPTHDLEIAYVKLTTPGPVVRNQTADILPGITSRGILGNFPNTGNWKIFDFSTLDDCLRDFVSRIQRDAGRTGALVENLFHNKKIVIDCLGCHLDDKFVSEIIKFCDDVRAINVVDSRDNAHFVSSEIAILVPPRFAAAQKLSDAFLAKPWDSRKTNVSVCEGSISFCFFTEKTQRERVILMLESTAHSSYSRGVEFAREEFMNVRDFPSKRNLLHELVHASARFNGVHLLIDYVLSKTVHSKQVMVANEGRGMLGYIHEKDHRGRSPLHENAKLALMRNGEISANSKMVGEILNKWSGPGVYPQPDNAGFTHAAIEVARYRSGVVLKLEHTNSVYLFCVGNQLGKTLCVDPDAPDAASSVEVCHCCGRKFTFVDATTGVVTNQAGIANMDAVMAKCAKKTEQEVQVDKSAIYLHRACFESLFEMSSARCVGTDVEMIKNETPFTPFVRKWSVPLVVCPCCGGEKTKVVLFPGSGICEKCFSGFRTVVHPIPLESRWKLKGDLSAVYRGGGKYCGEAFVRHGFGGVFISPAPDGMPKVKYPSYVSRGKWNELLAVRPEGQSGVVLGGLAEIGLFHEDMLLFPAHEFCKNPELLYKSFLCFGEDPWPVPHFGEKKCSCSN